MIGFIVLVWMIGWQVYCGLVPYVIRDSEDEVSRPWLVGLSMCLIGLACWPALLSGIIFTREDRWMFSDFAYFGNDDDDDFDINGGSSGSHAH